MYEGYTVSLALFDFIPVGLSVIAFYFLTKRIELLRPELTNLARFAWLFTCSAGVLKASWKLILASTGADVAWMSDQLFFLLFTGLTSMAMAVIWSKRSTTTDMSKRWMMVLIPIVLVVSYALYMKFSNPDSRAWNFMLLGLSTVSNLVLSITLIMQARKEHLSLAAVLIALNLIAVFVLSGLGRIEVQTAALQWIEEGVNTFAQGSFLYGVWMMYNYTRNNLSTNKAGAA